MHCESSPEFEVRLKLDHYQSSCSLLQPEVRLIMEIFNPGSSVRNVRSRRDLVVDDGDGVWSPDGYSSCSASRCATLDARRAGNSEATSTVTASSDKPERVSTRESPPPEYSDRCENERCDARYTLTVSA